jgi:chromosome segregation ATPase
MSDIKKIITISVTTLILVITGTSSIWVFLERNKILHQYLKERNIWQEKNLTLEQRLEEVQIKLKKFTEEINESRFRIKQFFQEKEELLAKYELMAKDNKRLASKAEELSEENNQLREKMQLARGTNLNSKGDYFWSNLLREKSRLEADVGELETKIKQQGKILASVEAEKNMLKETIDQLSKREKQLLAEVDELKGNVFNLEQQLDEEKQEKTGLLAKLDKLNEENMLFQNELDDLSKKKMDLEKQVSLLSRQTVESERQKEALNLALNRLGQSLEERIIEISNLRSKLEETVKEVKSTSLNEAYAIELPPIMVKPEDLKTDTSTSLTGKGDYDGSLFLPNSKQKKYDSVEREKTDYGVSNDPEGQIEAEVVLVNNHQGFAIIDKGSRDKIEVGNIFLVYRHQEKIATLKVVDIRQRTAACDIVELKTGAQIVEKDKAIAKN